MALKVVGAGLGRTGTHSLKVALEQLLGAPCYHMVEVFNHPEHVPMWTAALKGEPVDWDLLFTGYVATVDWPGGAVWREMSAAFPDAIVLLSSRRSADEWWTSASRTIFEFIDERDADNPEWHEMVMAMIRGRLTPEWPDEEATKAAYEAHNAAVRAEVPPEKLVDWTPQDGWEPICAALGVPVPDEPFPVTNTTAEFRAMMGRDPLPET
jgi:hypothetical protein